MSGSLLPQLVRVRVWALAVLTGQALSPVLSKPSKRVNSEKQKKETYSMWPHWEEE